MSMWAPLSDSINKDLIYIISTYTRVYRLYDTLTQYNIKDDTCDISLVHWPKSLVYNYRNSVSINLLPKYTHIYVT